MFLWKGNFSHSQRIILQNSIQSQIHISEDYAFLKFSAKLNRNVYRNAFLFGTRAELLQSDLDHGIFIKLKKKAASTFPEIKTQIEKKEKLLGVSGNVVCIRGLRKEIQEFLEGGGNKVWEQYLDLERKDNLSKFFQQPKKIMLEKNIRIVNNFFEIDTESSSKIVKKILFCGNIWMGGKNIRMQISMISDLVLKPHLRISFQTVGSPLTAQRIYVIQTEAIVIHLFCS